jgi:homogentisate 1,2-dioxygenase
MPHYLRIGSVPRKRHIIHPVKPGYRGEGLYYEEVVSTAGFSRAYSIAYHLRPPTRVRQITPAGSAAIEAAPLDVLRHVHLVSDQMPAGGDIVTGRIPLLFNDEVILSRCRPNQVQKELYRNATADEVIFIHKGKGVLKSMFGLLPFKPYDYVVVPHCTTFEMEFEPGVQPELLIIEAHGRINLPERYVNADGQIRLGAPYYERDFHGPREALVIDQEQDVPVLIKDGSRLSRYVLAQHPFDVIGWDGLVYPYTFNADDFEPITGTVHQPPPVQQTFEAPGFVVCTFAPRLLDTHPEAVKVPYAHSNVQADEVLYYVRGRFGSRRGVKEASFTLHPRGIPHGPHPGTIVASREMTHTDELAVMVDTFNPLKLTRAALALDDPKYPMSWLE